VLAIGHHDTQWMRGTRLESPKLDLVPGRRAVDHHGLRTSGRDGGGRGHVGLEADDRGGLADLVQQRAEYDRGSRMQPLVFDPERETAVVEHGRAGVGVVHLGLPHQLAPATRGDAVDVLARAEQLGDRGPNLVVGARPLARLGDVHPVTGRREWIGVEAQPQVERSGLGRPLGREPNDDLVAFDRGPRLDGEQQLEGVDEVGGAVLGDVRLGIQRAGKAFVARRGSTQRRTGDGARAAQAGRGGSGHRRLLQSSQIGHRSNRALGRSKRRRLGLHRGLGGRRRLRTFGIGGGSDRLPRLGLGAAERRGSKHDRREAAHGRTLSAR